MKLRLIGVSLVVLVAASPAASAHRPVRAFAPPRVISLPGMFARSLVLVDTNHDQHLDLVLSRVNAGSGSILVAFGNGRGRFARTQATDGVAGESMEPGDVNGDNNVDLAVASFCPNVQLGDGHGGFATKARMPDCRVFWPAGDLVALGDVTGDHKPDLVWSNHWQAMILAGDGHGAFAPTAATPQYGGFPMNDFLERIVIEDVNHDGIGDLVGAGQKGLTVVLSNGDGTLGAPVSYSFPREPSGWGHGPAWDVAVADLNHDGYRDFLVVLAGAEPPDPPGHGRIAVLYGSRSGTLVHGPFFSVGRVYYPWSIALADFNRDGKPDLVVADGLSRAFSRLLGVRGGRFGRPLVVHSPKQPVVLAAAGEVTGDRLPDVVLSAGQQGNTFALVFASRRR